jgi:riboflavin biosynthesis pyrimidine reductase
MRAVPSLKPDPQAAPTDSDHAALIAPLSADGRPCTAAVMVTSLDGRATSHGRVGPLTGAADQWLLLGVRERAEAILIGGRTLRAEGYGRLLGDEAKDRRRERGMPPEPRLYVLARELGGLQEAAALRPGGPPTTILHPPGAGPGRSSFPEHVETEVIPSLPDRRPDLRGGIGAVRRRHPRGLIASEGGPTLLGMLVEQRLLDQLLVAISPRLQGGAEKRLLELAATTGCEIRLQAVCAAGGFVFLRYDTTAAARP